MTVCDRDLCVGHYDRDTGTDTESAVITKTDVAVCNDRYYWTCCSYHIWFYQLWCEDIGYDRWTVFDTAI